jgi:hypothetical protein
MRATFERTLDLVTQFEVYVPYHQLDDCARDERPFTYHKEPFATVQSRQEGNQVWQELVICWGNIELLCNGGLIGTCGDHLVQTETFLGPTLRLKKMTFSSHDIFLVLVHDVPPKFCKDYRVLRDLNKDGAGYQWSYCSSRFAENHFFAVNLCNFHRHPARASRQTDVAWVSSFVFEKCLQNAMTGKEIEEARSGLAQARTLRLSSASSKKDVSLIGPVLDTLSQWSSFSSGSKPLDMNTTTVLATGSLKHQIQKLRKSIIEKEICMSTLL